MRTGKQSQPRKTLDDNYSTPKEAFDLVFKYLDVKDKRVWSPFYNDGQLIKYNFDCELIHEDKDFFKTNVNCDFIIDNPPYSIKHKVFERLILLNKPFAMLVPMDTMERQYFITLMKDKDLSIIIPYQRYKFFNNNASTTMPFKTIWVCVGCKLNKQIIFEI